MPRPLPRARTVGTVALGVALGVAVALGAAACGGAAGSKDAKTSSALDRCQDDWREVARSVEGLDQDTDPSALASRWTSVIATIDYYVNTTTATGCAANIAAQQKAISELRAFSDRVRQYDMVYQGTRVAAAVDLYLHDPLPSPTTGPDGKKVRPPTIAAVQAALTTLTEQGPTANEDLAPGWGQLASVELTDTEAVSSALSDLEFLAQDSTAWKQCEAALTVLTAAMATQDGGLAAAPTESPAG